MTLSQWTCLKKALNLTLFAIVTYGSQSVLDLTLILETYTRALLHHASSSSFVDKSCNQTLFFCSLVFDTARLLACFGTLSCSRHMVPWFVECYRCTHTELNDISHRPVTHAAGHTVQGGRTSDMRLPACSAWPRQPALSNLTGCFPS